MILQRTIDTYTGLFDFNTTGGAIGSYDLQVPIPKNAVIMEFVACSLIQPTSGGAAVITFDIINNSVAPVVTTVGGLMLATPYGIFLNGAAIFGIDGSAGDVIFPNGLTYSGIVGNMNPSFQALNPFSIGISIGVAPLTAGKIMVACRCMSFDLPQ